MPPQSSETATLTGPKDVETPTLNYNKTKECHLKWTGVMKTVEIKDQSVGLIRSSIGGKGEKETSSLPKSGDTKIILNQISGEAKAGQIMALMGPSGSGKTSLLDVLASRSAYTAGTIYLNDSSMTEDPAKMKSLKRKIAYIKQKDIFFEHLSVKDQLMYTAFLRLGDNYTREEKIEEVDKVIKLLRLERCADTQIQLVSGGERKRTNIGTELLINPSIIMLDEPTSGLDSTSAVALMSLLVSLAHDHGKTVITSIHQPSSAIFRKFDKVMFLADGCLVYHGSPTDSLSYCARLGYGCPDGYNAADHWMDLLVEDSAIPTSFDETIMEDEQDNEIGADSTTFPVKLNEVEVDIENNIHENDEVTKLTTTAKTSKKSKHFGSAFTNRLSTRTNTQSKGVDIYELARLKRDEYKKMKTPKGSLVSAWDVDGYTAQLEDSIMNQSTHSSATAQSDLNEGTEDKKFNTSWATQFRILLHRSLKNSSASILTPLNLSKSVALGILTGLLWFQVSHEERDLSDRHSFIFFSITYWVFDGTFTAIFTFPSERAIIFKERASGSYHLSAYFLSKTISEMPTRLSLPCMYWAIAYWMAGINYSFLVFLGTMGCVLLAVLAGESYGLLCGALVMDFQKAMTIMIVISLTSMAAGGFYVQNVPTWLAFVKYTSPFKFGYEASQLLVFNDAVRCDGSGVLAAYCTEGVKYATKEEVLEFINSEGTLGFNIGMMIILIIVPRYLSFFALKAKRGAERS